MGIIPTKIMKMKIFESFGHNWENLNKKLHFSQNQMYLKAHFAL